MSHLHYKVNNDGKYEHAHTKTTASVWKVVCNESDESDESDAVATGLSAKAQKVRHCLLAWRQAGSWCQIQALARTKILSSSKI